MIGLLFHTRQFVICSFIFLLLQCSVFPTTLYPRDDNWKISLRRDLKHGFIRAVSSPKVWGPFLGTLVLRRWDKDISDWAVKETPIFGSPKNARLVSDIFQTAMLITMPIPPLLAPEEETEIGFWGAKVKRLAIQAVGFGFGFGTTLVLKTTIHRERPSGEDRRSFPSGHATITFLAAGWLEKNITSFSPYIKYPLNTIAYTAAVATAWARVEGEKHYPIDVLAGVLIANFFTEFFAGAFLSDVNVPLSFSAGQQGDLQLSMSWQF